MATQNGPVSMYKLKPLYDFSEKVEVSDCMYRLPDLHGNNSTASQVSPPGGSTCPVDQLEQRQEAILRRLGELKKQVEVLSGSVQNDYPSSISNSAQAISQPKAPRPKKNAGAILEDVVVNADPSSPPLSLFILYHLLSDQIPVLGATHIHSSVSKVTDTLKQAFGNHTSDRTNYQLALTLIWKDVQCSPQMMVSPSVQSAIHGEGNIARYLARSLEPSYEDLDAATATEIDTLVDMATGQLLKGNSKEKASILRSLNSKLGKNTWLVGSGMSLADIVMWSVLHQTGQAEGAPTNVKTWLKTCNSHPAFQFALRLAQAQ